MVAARKGAGRRTKITLEVLLWTEAAIRANHAQKSIVFNMHKKFGIGSTLAGQIIRGLRPLMKKKVQTRLAQLQLSAANQSALAMYAILNQLPNAGHYAEMAAVTRSQLKTLKAEIAAEEAARRELETERLRKRARRAR
jgi:cytochrome b561